MRVEGTVASLLSGRPLSSCSYRENAEPQAPTNLTAGRGEEGERRWGGEEEEEEEGKGEDGPSVLHTFPT